MSAQRAEGSGSLDEPDGDDWWRWSPLFESALESVNAALVELADLQPGQRVLDRSTGCDEPAATAALRVGPVGSVVAADADDRDLADASFDAALCRFALSFVPNVAADLQRLAALLVPGGRLAAAVWGPPARCSALSIPWATMCLFMEPNSLPPGAAGLFGLGAQGVLDDELHFAGFTGVRSRPLRVVFTWESAEEFASFHQAAVVPIHGAVATMSSERRREMREALVGIARTRAGVNGGLRLEAEVVVVVGTRPPDKVGDGLMKKERV